MCLCVCVCLFLCLCVCLCDKLTVQRLLVDRSSLRWFVLHVLCLIIIPQGAAVAPSMPLGAPLLPGLMPGFSFSFSHFRHSQVARRSSHPMSLSTTLGASTASSPHIQLPVLSSILLIPSHFRFLSFRVASFCSYLQGLPTYCEAAHGSVNDGEEAQVRQVR